MGRHIIEHQGVYHIFSTIVDAFIAENLTKDELYQFYIDEYSKKAIHDVDKSLSLFSRLKTSLSYSEALEIHNSTLEKERGIDASK